MTKREQYELIVETLHNVQDSITTGIIEFGELDAIIDSLETLKAGE